MGVGGDDWRERQRPKQWKPPRRSSAEGQDRDETPNKLKKKKAKQKKKTERSGSNQKKKSALSSVVSVFLSIPLVFNNIQHPPGWRRETEERENGWRCALRTVEPTLFYAKQNSSRFFDQLKIMCHGFVFLNFFFDIFVYPSMALYSAARAASSLFLYFFKKKKKI